MILKHCRICKGSTLQPYLNLGFTPAADSFIREQGLKQPEAHYPLEVYLCMDCGISQLGYTVPPDILYQQDYPYESSTTQAGRTHFFDFSTSVVKRLNLKSESLAIDVGSNVGVLLDGFKKNGCRALGIEPSANIAATAVGRGIETINDFISQKLAAKIVASHGQASVVTITNVFAHIDDLDDFMQSVNTLLTENGMLIIEAPHFLKLLKNLEYDTIYHEHLLYIAIRPLNKLFNRFGFEVSDVQEMGIHGGSIRIYVSRTNAYPIAQTVRDMIQREEEAKIFDLDRLLEFSKDVAKHRTELLALLHSLKAKGASIVGVSAPAKGMTLLNYNHIGPELLDFMTEKSPLKIGLYTPGLHIPILPDSALTEHQPDYALLLAWNFAEEIMANLKTYREKGGKFIIPIPSPHIV
jgi:SAM-dependent methyltransferase